VSGSVNRIDLGAPRNSSDLIFRRGIVLPEFASFVQHDDAATAEALMPR